MPEVRTIMVPVKPLLALFLAVHRATEQDKELLENLSTGYLTKHDMTDAVTEIVRAGVALLPALDTEELALLNLASNKELV
jgi:hypothetical protein